MTLSVSDCSRRDFARALCGFPFAFSLSANEAAEFAGMPWNQPATVAKVYLGAPKAFWPKPDLDLAREVAAVEAGLADVARKHARNVRFVGGELIRTEEEVRPWIERTGEVDGVLIMPVCQPTPPLRALATNLRVPALFFSRPYATHAWSSIGDLQRAGHKIDVLASSSFGDLDSYLPLFRTAHHMRTSKIIVGVATPGARQAQADAYRDHFGSQFQFFAGREFERAFASVDPKEAAREAEAFTRQALRVVEPSPKEISDGLRFHLGLIRLLKQERANAVAIDCFGTLAANTLPGYPCISFSKLNDIGLYGVCEGDLASTMTQMLVTSYAGVPGFISDPVFDTSRNEVVHAHCVSATRLKGSDQPPSPYIIRNHLETNEGAVLQVLMPVGEIITVGRFAGPKKFLLSTAEVTGVPSSDRGCRSQISTRVRGDAEKWLRGYSHGLHRVIFYGDHSAAIRRMGRLMGFEVVDEA